MECHQCGSQNPPSSLFCRKCGANLEAGLRCAHCGFDNPGDSLFCTRCGQRFSKIKKSVRGPQRKCRTCGHFNELDALFCVACGEKITPRQKKEDKRSFADPSFKTIAFVIVLVILAAFFTRKATTIFRSGKPTGMSSAPISYGISMSDVDEEKVIAVARNFKCACGGCGELPLETCECDMPRGSVEEKNFIREKLAEGLTVEQVIELLDKKYGHRI